MGAVPISRLGLTVAGIGGVKRINPDFYNPWATVLKAQEAKREIDTKAARTFLQLLDQGQVPCWVSSVLDVELIRLAAS